MYVLSREINKNKNSFHGSKYLKNTKKCKIALTPPDQQHHQLEVWGIHK